MKIIELSRKRCDEDYNGNFKKMIEVKDGLIFDAEITQRAFNFGNGTEKDLKEYIRNNKIFCKYYDLENQKYI